ncbi:MAG: RagB/SusD family nutrient uptake outer membrane protein [Bacteroidales bacterium]
MKIKAYVIIIAGMLLIISSCSKVIDTIPEDSITDLNYWKTPADMQLFANGFYNTLDGPTYNSQVFYDAATDNYLPSTPDPRFFNNLSVPATGGGWAATDWANIRNLNYVLTHYQTVVGDPTDIKQNLGEIKFFRANEYFNKVKSFGDVPWVSKNLNVTDVNILYAARTPMNVVIDSIIADLQFAVANLKLPSQLPVGRLHKYAAEVMLARVALFEGTYLKYRGQSGNAYLTIAVNACQDIMTNGGYQIVKANTNFYIPGYPLYYKAQFITEDLTSNKECILPRIFITNIVTNRQSGSAFGTTAYSVPKDFIEDFLCTDGLPIALSPLYHGDDSASMEMTNRDPRLRNTIDNKLLPMYMKGTELVTYPVTPVAANVCPTGYMPSKYRDPLPIQNDANMTSDDWNIFRYAEVLLTFAEAKAELGDITQGDIDNSINLLRARLDEPGNFTMGRLSISPPVDPNSLINGQPRYGYVVSPLIYEIRRERRVELSFENRRWEDILRWKAGKLLENPKTMVGIVVNNDVIARYKFYNNGLDQFAGRALLNITDWDGKNKNLIQAYAIASRTWVDKLYFLPLPSDQLTLNTKLVQNPGW